MLENYDMRRAGNHAPILQEMCKWKQGESLAPQKSEFSPSREDMCIAGRPGTRFETNLKQKSNLECDRRCIPRGVMRRA